MSYQAVVFEEVNQADLQAAVQSVMMELSGFGQGGISEGCAPDTDEIIREKARLYDVPKWAIERFI